MISLSGLGDDHALADGARGDLGAGERLDEVVIVEDVAFARGEQPQDLPEVVEQLGVVGKGDDELILCCSSCGRSSRTTRPSSWSSSPESVTVKLMSVTLMQTSGR